MGASQRTKGQVGEREVANILSSALGIEVARNWRAQFDGGAFDLIGLPGWAVEVKRAKREDRAAWWRQAAIQAASKDLLPALIYRIDGFGKGLPPDEKWQVIVPAHTLMDTTDKAANVQMTLRTWIYMLAKLGWREKSEAAIPF